MAQARRSGSRRHEVTRKPRSAKGWLPAGARFGFACFVLRAFVAFRAFVVQAFGGRGVVRSRSSTFSAKSNFLLGAGSCAIQKFDFAAFSKVELLSLIPP